MDFQYLLELAAKNQENAEKKLPVTKRYSTKVPPPKKHERPTVNPNAIRARIEQKEKEKIQKAEDEERERVEGQKRQVEAEKKKKKERKTRSPKKSAFSSASHVKEAEISSSDEESGRRQEQPRAEQKENAKAHKSFMHKLEREAERRREHEARRDAESKPAKPKSTKKSAPVPKKPMSFEELMKFAKTQQQGGGKSSAPAKRDEEVEEDDDEEEEEDRRDHKKSGKGLDRRENHSAIKKGQSSKHNGEHVRTKTVQNGQGKSSVSSGSGSQTKHKLSAGVGKGGVLGKERRTNGELVSKEKSVKGMAERQNVQSRDHERPSTSGKSKPRPCEVKSSGVSSGKVPSRPGERPASSVKQGDNRLQGKQNERPSARPHPKQSERSAGGSTSRDRPRPGERPPTRPGDGPRAKLDDRPKSGQRPPRDDPSRPRSSGMGPPRSQEALRKRPAPSQQAMRMKVKQGRLCSDSEESDYDDGDGFIDDTPLEEMGCSNVSSYIKEIFGYDKSKYGYESDYALKSMDASYRDIQKEESRSARLGMMEDLEDIRKEKEENRRKALGKKGKKR